MSKFGRALAGGVAGMAGATGEVFDNQIKSKEFDRKSAIIEKRERTLASFRAELAAGQDEIQYGRKEKTRLAEQAYKEESGSSGMVSSLGMPLSKRDLSRQSDAAVGKNLSIKDYAADERAVAWGEKQEELDYKQEDAIELQKVRNQGRSLAKPDKVSAADKKLAQSNARAGIESKLSSYDPFYDKVTKTYELNIVGKPEAEIKSILMYIDSKGFQVNANQPDKDILMLSLGEFNYDIYQASLDPDTTKKYEDVKKETVNKFDQLKAALAIKAPGSLMNDEQSNDGLKSSHSMAAPKQYPIDNTQRQ